jgi:FkbM family methyltransferase
MANILLDCGCHYGKGLRKQIDMHRIDSTWQIYCWEANPYTYEHFKKNTRFHHLNVTAYHAAVSDHDGTVSFNVQASSTDKGGTGKSGTGSSIIDLDQWHCKGGNFVEQVTVPTVDLSAWIINNTSQQDYVILKMDVEGAEYDVLEKIIDTGAIDLIDRLYIEWHAQMFSNPLPYEIRQQAIMSSFQLKEIPIENW